MQRHWSFVATDKRYMYLIAAAILVAGLASAFSWRDATFFARAGNFIIGTGVWMAMRFTLREEINRTKNGLDNSPFLPGEGRFLQLNPTYFNNITFSTGDAFLQLHGFSLVLIGSLVSSFGDLLLLAVVPARFGNHV